MVNSLTAKRSRVKVEGTPHEGCSGSFRYSFRVESADVNCKVEMYACDYCGDRSVHVTYFRWWEIFKRFFS